MWPLSPPSYGGIQLPDGASPDCPYVREPLSDCYCRSLTSATIPLVVYFCRELYVHCPIYRSNHDALLSGDPPPARDRQRPPG